MSRLPAIENPYDKTYPSDLSDAEWLIMAGATRFSEIWEKQAIMPTSHPCDRYNPKGIKQIERTKLKSAVQAWIMAL